VTLEATEIIRFLRGLRAVRELLPDPIPAEAVRDIIEVARWTGSSQNKQPWELVVVADRADLHELARISKGNAAHAANAGLALVVVLSGTSEIIEAYDDGRLSERIMLAAKAHGLGSAIGWFNTAAKQTEAKRFLGIPEERRVRTLISIGRIDEAARAARSHPAEARKPIERLVHWGRYTER
jgi:nitroreductase